MNHILQKQEIVAKLTLDMTHNGRRRIYYLPNLKFGSDTIFVDETGSRDTEIVISHHEEWRRSSNPYQLLQAPDPTGRTFFELNLFGHMDGINGRRDGMFVIEPGLLEEDDDLGSILLKWFKEHG